MPRDYAPRKSSSKRKARQPQYNPYKIILFAIVIMGALYFLNQTGKLQQLKQQILAAMSVPSHTKSPAVSQVAAQQPRFEFYTLLPKNNPHLNGATVTTAQPAATVAITTTAKSNSTVATSTATQATPAKPSQPMIPAASKSHYILQVASFRTMGEADNLKAKLVFAGFDVAIEKFSNHGQEWFRVKVGPYTSSHQASVAQQRLQHQQYHAIVKRVG